MVTQPFNLMQWIQEHDHEFKEPVMNKQFYREADDVIVFVSKGPNARNDYHVNETEELFYQLKGDIAVRIRPLDGSDPHDIIVREGEMWLLPRLIPHRPQRPDGTLGLIVEFPRPEGTVDKLRWYCNADQHLVHEAEFRLKHIDQDLHRVMDEFWNGPEQVRTCEACGTVVERAGEFEMSMAQPQSGKTASENEAASVRDCGATPVRDCGATPVRDCGATPVRDCEAAPVREGEAPPEL